MPLDKGEGFVKTHFWCPMFWHRLVGQSWLRAKNSEHHVAITTRWIVPPTIDSALPDHDSSIRTSSRRAGAKVEIAGDFQGAPRRVAQTSRFCSSGKQSRRARIFLVLWPGTCYNHNVSYIFLI